MSARALPTLDVVIPCYNEQDDIGQCLESVLAQGDELHEIIIVDNNSTDDTLAIVEEFMQRHKVIRLVHEPLQGIEYARDAGIGASRADIVARIDADTRVLPGWSRAIREFYATHPEVAAGSGTSEYYDLPFRRFTNMMTWLTMAMTNQVIARSYGLYGANMSLRTAAWKELCVALPSRGQHLMEDLSISLALQQLGYSLSHIPHAGAHVSGRRIRSRPIEFMRYNRRWPNTYRIMGFSGKARLITLASWLGNIAQAVASLLLRFHDPHTGKFSIRHFWEGYEARPWL